MPCGDVREFFELELDAEERLRSFSLHKRSCHAPVGDNGVLSDLLRGYTVDGLLELRADDLPATARRNRLSRFLLDKQLRTVKAALRVLVGLEGGGRDDDLSVASVAMSSDGITISGLANVALDATKIDPCGNCCKSDSRSSRSVGQDKDVTSSNFDDRVAAELP